MLQHSLAAPVGGSGPPPGPPPSEEAIENLPVDAMMLMARQIGLLSRWSAAPDAVKRAAQRCASSFGGSLDLLQPSVGDNPDASINFIAALVAKLKALAEGQALIIARPEEATEGSGCLLFVVHRCHAAAAGSEFALAVCASSEAALEYFPTRLDSATGELQHPSWLLLRDVPYHRVCDGAFWYLAVLADHKWCKSSTLFEKLLPALNLKPLLANWAPLSTGGGGRSGRASGGGDALPPAPRLGEPATPHWVSCSRGRGGGLADPMVAIADPHGYELVSLAAMAALSLTAEGGAAVGEGVGPTPAGLELLLQHMLLVATHVDLDRMGHLKPSAPPLPAATTELLWRATKRCSASTAMRVVGAASLGAPSLKAMQKELNNVKAAIAALRARGSHKLDTPLSPPDSAAVLCASDRLPNFARLRDVEPKDALAGEAVQRPLVMPVALSSVPTTVVSVEDASNALHRCCHLCTLLSNQHGLVRDSFALRIGLLTHLFLRVLPLPLPPTRRGRVAPQPDIDTPPTCFWADARISADTQSAILRWLSTLCRHFAAASLAVPLGRSFDAARMLVFGAIASLVDAVLRVEAFDTPSALSLHYGGHIVGAAGAFALDMRHLEHESESGQLLQPRFGASPLCPAMPCSNSSRAIKQPMPLSPPQCLALPCPPLAPLPTSLCPRLATPLPPPRICSGRAHPRARLLPRGSGPVPARAAGLPLGALDGLRQRRAGIGGAAGTSPGLSARRGLASALLVR